VYRNGQAQKLPFDFSDESSGTQLWFKLIGPILNVLRTGRILLLDELSLSLHPQLTYHLVEIFQDIETNPLEDN
jgi:predicted ATPase